MKNKVFIATSLDGFIADKNGKIDFLHSTPNPNGDDMGYGNFISGIDAIIMGRTTYEVVLGFDVDWPYSVPVFVLSSSIKSIPKSLQDKVQILSGSLNDILDQIHLLGYANLYIDGGKTIQSFLNEDLIDEITITRIPLLLGEGIPLFGSLIESLNFRCTESKIYLNSVVQNKFERNI
ncbi:MAG: dihydrofolate reductase family protein [Bacteroidia bacterium]